MQYLRPALVLTLFFVLLTGLAFPAVVWALGQTAFPSQAAGSMVRNAAGSVVGSELLGQNFTQPRYFHPRPSAAGAGYDAANSSGSNLGPTSDKLIHGVKDDPATPNDETYLGFGALAELYRAENGLEPGSLIPADAATRSASGLDPEISLANAELQVARVAQARQMDAAQVRATVARAASGRLIGFVGEPRVNVLKLNLALDARD